MPLPRMKQRNAMTWLFLGSALVILLMYIAPPSALIFAQSLDGTLHQFMHSLWGLHVLRIVTITLLILIAWPFIARPFVRHVDLDEEVLSDSRYWVLCWYLIFESLLAIGAYG